MIKYESVTKIYGREKLPAVDSVNFEVNDGEIVGFAGLNGAGKSTAIRMTAGIVNPSKGTIKIDGYDIVHEKKKASYNIGWVPELPNFDGNFTPVKLMKYYAGFYDIKNVDGRISELLEEVSLGRFRDRKLKNFSQGMKKRFSLASALLSDPQNFLFDETLNGLDPEGIKFFRDLIVKYRSEGKAILLSSHILSELENLADRIVIINKGKVVKDVKIDEISSNGAVKIRIKVRNPDDRVLDILSPYGKVSREGNEIVVAGVLKDYSELNGDLLRSGYAVTYFNVETESLEDYFFSSIGDAR